MKLFNINKDTMVRSYAVATSILLFGSLSVDALINGEYTVKAGDHFANKSCWFGFFCQGPNWGSNSESKWFAKVTFPDAAADYEGSSCFENDSDEFYDWNKLIGKARCNGNHQNDSDRFVWRRLQDIHSAPNCGESSDCRGIQIATYSYDDGRKPYLNENWELSRTFSTILQPKTPYIIGMESFSDGRVVHTLHTEDWTLLETQTNQHSKLCPSNYEQGSVLGLYFGGTCQAPQDITITYESVEEPEEPITTSTLATSTSIATSSSTVAPTSEASSTSTVASTSEASTTSSASTTTITTTTQQATTSSTSSQASSTTTESPVSCNINEWYFVSGNSRVRDCSWIAKRKSRRCKKLGGFGSCSGQTKCSRDIPRYDTDSCERMRARVACPSVC